MEQQLKQTLRDLVAFPSVSSDTASNQAALRYVHDQFKPLGFIIETHLDQDRPWIVVSTQNTKEPDILLAAHVDVVPAVDSLFTLREDGDKLIGRGVCDMKFAAACYIELAKKQSDKLRNLNIAFLFTSDEELGGDSVIDFLNLGWRPKCVLLPDGAEDWHIEGRAKGPYGFRLEATGIAAHGSRPWEGDNALHRIMDVCNALRQLYPDKGTADATLSVNKIVGGETVNQIPDSAFALIDFRSFDKQELAAYRHTAEIIAKQHNVTLSIPYYGSPVIFDKNHPRVQGFLGIFASITGQPVRYVDAFGGTDARHFAEYDIPCIITSPRCGGRHADTEWLLADDLFTFYTLVERWVLDHPTA